MTVSLSIGTSIVAVMGIVTEPPPQSNVTMPPFETAALSASNVQLAAVPVPTTVAGFDVSAGCPPAGTPAAHDVSGLPAFHGPPLVVPPEPPLPEPPVEPPPAPVLPPFELPPFGL